MISRDMTSANLRSAFGGESMAHMRYKIWSAKAHREGFKNVARLFEAISFAEQAHASGHFKAMYNISGDFLCASMAGFGNGSTSQNLAAAAAGEKFEVNEMYPSYIAVARQQGEARAERSMTFALEAEKIHEELYLEAKAAVDGGKDWVIPAVQVCAVCGHTVVGDAPDTCPICQATRRAFKAFA